MGELTAADFAPWLDRWRLAVDGEAFLSPHSKSLLLPVHRDSAHLILKVSTAPEEIAGGALMAWWAGEGAAHVLEREGGAILLERAAGGRSLAAMVQDGDDDQATRILCAVAARLHAPRSRPAPASLAPLDRWFRALEPGAARHGGVLGKSLAASRRLLASPRDNTVLHGDLHHGNVLDAGPRGWLAIDPKGLIGERGFDHANMLCNPDPEMALAPGRLARQAAIVAAASGLDVRRLMTWALAYAGLSAAWTLESGGDASPALAIAERAAAELDWPE